MRLLFTILMLASLVIGCNPVTPEAPKELGLTPQATIGECYWTAPVKIGGSGTGAFLYDANLECSCADLDCEIFIANIYGSMLECRLYVNTTPVGVFIAETGRLSTFTYFCGPAILFNFNFPDAPSLYAVGDSWYFNLTY